MRWFGRKKEAREARTAPENPSELAVAVAELDGRLRALTRRLDDLEDSYEHRWRKMLKRARDEGGAVSADASPHDVGAAPAALDPVTAHVMKRRHRMNGA